MSEITISNLKNDTIEIFNKAVVQLGITPEELFSEMVSIYSFSKLGSIRKILFQNILFKLNDEQMKTNIFVHGDADINQLSPNEVTTRTISLLKNSKLPELANAYIGIYIRDIVVRFEIITTSRKKTEKYQNLFDSNQWFKDNNFSCAQKSKTFVIENRQSIQNWHLVNAYLIAETFKNMCIYLDLV